MKANCPFLPVPARRAGRLILVDPPAAQPAGVTVVYARVSSADQRPVQDVTEILTSLCARLYGRRAAAARAARAVAAVTTGDPQGPPAVPHGVAPPGTGPAYPRGAVEPVAPR